jgi:RHS repeat-associated protein
MPDQAKAPKEGAQKPTAPSISLPKGGGAIHGIGEKFSANPVTGTGSMNVPIGTSPGRSGFGPQLSLSYDSGSGNGPFGFGWQLSIPSITRKTDKGLPKYDDSAESDVFVLSGAEDLVPLLDERPTGWKRPDPQRRTMNGTEYTVRRYRPRIEGLFARIERWTGHTNAAHTFWRSISRDNITTWYGKTEESRVADPLDPGRIFQWLICETYDDKGNVIAYGYKKENSDGVDVTRAHERNRSDATRSANRYMKRVRYGNRVPYFPDPVAAPAVPLPVDWCFDLVFDYGDQDTAVPLPDEPTKTWACRRDPFSSHRATFDVRTYRLCRRVLIFHHFAGQPGVGRNCLVRSTDLTYTPDVKPADPRNPIYSFLVAVTQTGYVRQGGSYLSKSLPPLEFAYTEPVIDPTVKDVDDADSLENLPEGLDAVRHQFVDLDGDGLSGILTEQAGSWIYKHNFSPSTLTSDGGKPRPLARFGPAEFVSRIPSLAALSSGRQQLLDLAGDGQLDLVDFQSATSGFFERTANAGWEPFKPFDSQPVLNWSDPGVKFIDLTGDGHADILITEDQALCWHESLGEAGFGPAERVLQAFDEETGPRLAFADSSESVFLADLSGDGLTDLVRVRNGEVCYWPNLGYGRFGAKVAMDDAPWFESADLFDGRRIRLADIDGSGTTDIIYFGTDGLQLFFNQSGNGWSARRTLNPFPPVDNSSTAAALDLLGNGTACLVWSSPLPGSARRPMRYVDLMGGTKPHLLISASDNLGAETRVHYAPSTKFSVMDRMAGQPWITKVPFPVHVVERLETYDYISRNHFVTRYAYHHGFYDGVEREFRGFGLVEQWDTELLAALAKTSAFPEATNVDSGSHVPPVRTKTWFHTGVYLGRDQVSRFFAGLTDAKDTGEYYREPGLTDEQAARLLLDDTVLETGWTVEEEREACRALKGSMLRQEVYALDGSDKQDHPYKVTEQNFSVVRAQPVAGNRHGVFLATAREALTYSYERNPVDPRVSHALTLEVDVFGNIRRSLAIGYGRRGGNSPLTGVDLAKQTTPLVTYTENDVTNVIDDPDAFRTPLPSATRTYELSGFSVTDDTARPAFDTWTAGNFALLQAAIEIHFEQPANALQKEKRLIDHIRTRYRSDDMKKLLAQNVLKPLALPGESYKLAFTPGLLTEVYRRTVAGQPPEDLLPDRLTVLFTAGGDRGGYVDLDADGHAWIPSGRVFFWSGANAANPAATAAQETMEARAHFFQPRKWVDPFGQSATAAYDGDNLFVTTTTDAIGNTLSAQHDYRMLKPSQVTDPNGNAAEAAFDALGLLVATAVRGKAGQDPGDTIIGVASDLTTAEIIGFFDAADPHTISAGLLKTATSRIVYDVDRFRRTRMTNPADSSMWEPVCAASLARETHVNDPLPPGEPKIQVSVSYSDGFGREIQKKIQAEAGPVVAGGGAVVAPRWVGSGWTIYNNKGQPVRTYEPFFAATHRFEFAKQAGVSNVLFYDPVGRPIATLNPNDTFEKVLFDPWLQTTCDVNDTAALDPRTDPNINGYVRQYFAMHPVFSTWSAQRLGGALGPFEKDAAEKTAVHAGTPLVAHFDVLGRPFLTIAHNRSLQGGALIEERHSGRLRVDVEGNQREVRDAMTAAGDPLGRIVMRYDYDMLGNRIHQASMEAGERWMLNDVTGKPLYAWDGRDHRFRSTYDALRRPTDVHLREGAGAESLIGRTVYGENRPNAEADNLRGMVVQLFDQAGVVTSDAYDFKGNLLRRQRQLAHAYRTTLDWSAAVPLDAPVYSSGTRYDALNRPIQLLAPHSDQPGSTVNIIQPVYNEANLLEQVHAWLNQSAEPVGALITGTAGLHAVTNFDYDAKGQRMLIDFGNGVRTTYAYDPLTFRLVNLVTRRGADVLQDLHYTFDPAGNITHIRDDAQQTIFFSNKRVEPSTAYTYDALYRLIEATGREHLGQVGDPPSPPSYNDTPRVGIAFAASDGTAMGRYLERYVYDAAGNFKTMQHAGTDPADPGWTRDYTYGEPSIIEAGKQSNRLTSTFTDPTKPETYSTGGNGYDAHGNMLRMTHLQEMRWDFKDQLRMTQRQKVNAADIDGAQHQGERTWYVYDASGQRMRKVTELATDVVKEERIYLGGFEIYHRAGANPLVRETLHLMDDKQRIALVETRTEGNENRVPRQLIRYQLGNHLGSAGLELDDQARIISYEEYTPYGSTSYQAVRSQTETSKRYRYTGKERDEESGLYYHGARYYAPWLGRWSSCDPGGTVDGYNLYLYVRGSPTKLTDHAGFEGHTDDYLDAGVPTPAMKAEGLHLETERTAKEKQATLPPGGAADKQPASLGFRPAETNKHANAWAARESRTGVKAGVINAAATLSEGPLAVLPWGTPWGNKIRALAPKTETELAQNTAFWTEFMIVMVVSEGVGEFTVGASVGKAKVTGVEIAKPQILREPPPLGTQLSLFPSESVPAFKLAPSGGATPTPREIPYQIDMGEVKSSNWSVDRTIDYQGKFVFQEGLDVKGGTQAAIRYTPDHQLVVDLRELGGMEGPIGRRYTLMLDPVEAQQATAGLRFGSADYGKVMEGLAVRRVGKATGQAPVQRPAEQRGADFLPTQLGFRVLGFAF